MAWPYAVRRHDLHPLIQDTVTEGMAMAWPSFTPIILLELAAFFALISQPRIRAARSPSYAPFSNLFLLRVI